MANFVLSNPLEILGGISGNVLANVGGGYALLNEQATAINPTIAPNKLILGTGISAVDNEGAGTFHIITDDIPVMNFSLANIVATVTNSFEVNGAFFVDGNSDTIQMRVDAHSTQTSLLLRIRDSSAAEIFTINNAGTVTVGFGQTVPADALVIDIETPSGNSTFRDSHTFVMRGKARQAGGTPRPSEWRQLVDATNADGESSFLFQAVNPFSQNVLEVLRLGNGGNITIPNGFLQAGNAAGYVLLNEAATSTNPTLIPRRADLTTGIGGTDAEGDPFLHFIIGGANTMSLSSAAATFTLTDRIQLNGRLQINGNSNQTQLFVRGFSTQTDTIVLFQNNAQDSLLEINDLGTTTLGAEVVAPIDVLVLGHPGNPGPAGTINSHNLVFTGTSFDGVAHIVDWRMRVNVSDNTGSPSQFFITQELDGGGEAVRFQIDDDGAIHIGGEIDHNGAAIGFFGIAPVARASAYTLTNVSADRAFDANSVAIAELADVVGTLINDLIAYGLLDAGGA